MMLLQLTQSLEKQLGPMALDLGAFFPGGMGAGTEWCQRILQREHIGLECQPGIGLWNFGENQVLSQSLTKRGHCPRNCSHMYACVRAKWLQLCLTLQP